MVNLSTRYHKPVPFSFGNLKMESGERNEYTVHRNDGNNSLGRPFKVHLIITGEAL